MNRGWDNREKVLKELTIADVEAQEPREGLQF
jgi:hypothetical protein